MRLPVLALRFLSTVRSFAAAQQAVAAVEFALILPFMLTLYMGTIEISDLIAVDRRVTVVSGTIGDLVARSSGSITTSELTNYFDAAEGIVLPYSRTGLKQVVTAVEVSSVGVTTVKWSVGNNGGTAKTVGAAYTLPTSMNTISRGSWVIVSQASYSYRPLLGLVVQAAINLNRESYYLPRTGTKICYNTATC